MQSKKYNSYFAKITLLCGNFLDCLDEIWKTKIQCADIIHLDNVNWWKSALPAKDAIIPKKKGNYAARTSTDANVAYFLRRYAKLNAVLVVYLDEHFQLGFNFYCNFKVKANWNSTGTTNIHLYFLTEKQEEPLPLDLGFVQLFEPVNIFSCRCGTVFVYQDRLCIDDIYVCKTCQVLNPTILLCAVATKDFEIVMFTYRCLFVKLVLDFASKTFMISYKWLKYGKLYIKKLKK